jgi:hypothetical protein
MSHEVFSRRRILQGAIAVAAAPAAILVARDARAATALSESDPAAKSLGYVTDAKRVSAATNPTYKPGQTCANCIQYGGGATEGKCAIFPNHTVKATGWCKVWVPKPA